MYVCTYSLALSSKISVSTSFLNLNTLTITLSYHISFLFHQCQSNLIHISKIFSICLESNLPHYHLAYVFPILKRRQGRDGALIIPRCPCLMIIPKLDISINCENNFTISGVIRFSMSFAINFQTNS